MRITSVTFGRLCVLCTFALAGCASVIVLNPDEAGSGGAGGETSSSSSAGGGPVDAGMDAPQADADKCSVANLTDGLVAYYPFDGDTTDATGHGLNGVPEGMYSYSAGKYGQGIFFQGWETRVTVPESPPLDTFDQFTLSVWVNPDSYPMNIGVNPVILAKLYSPSVYGSYVLNTQLLNTGLVDMFSVAYVDTPGDGGPGTYKADNIFVSDDQAAPKRIPIGAWTLVTATFDHGMMALYLNGKIVAQKDSVIKHVETTHYMHDDLVIGNVWSDWAHDYAWHGGLDDVRLYNRPLSADEVACIAKM